MGNGEMGYGGMLLRPRDPRPVDRAAERDAIRPADRTVDRATALAEAAAAVAPPPPPPRCRHHHHHHRHRHPCAADRATRRHPPRRSTTHRAADHGAGSDADRDATAVQRAVAQRIATPRAASPGTMSSPAEGRGRECGECGAEGEKERGWSRGEGKGERGRRCKGAREAS